MVVGGGKPTGAGHYAEKAFARAMCCGFVSTTKYLMVGTTLNECDVALKMQRTYCHVSLSWNSRSEFDILV